MLALLAVDRKENELVIIPTVLAPLDLMGMVVVGDVMQTYRQLSSPIVETGGDDLWFVKDNQPTLHANIAGLFTALPALPGTSEDQTVSRRKMRVGCDAETATGHGCTSYHGGLGAPGRGTESGRYPAPLYLLR